MEWMETQRFTADLIIKYCCATFFIRTHSIIPNAIYAQTITHDKDAPHSYLNVFCKEENKEET